MPDERRRPKRVVLDVDTGVDDAQALLLAIRSPEVNVLGITCVSGNVSVDVVVGRAARLLICWLHRLTELDFVAI